MTMLNENEKFRLLRMTPGANVDDVLEELFSMASDKQRQEFPYGIDVTPRNPKNPPIVMDFSPDVPGTIFRVNRGDSSFDLQFNPDNSLSIVDNATGEEVGGGGGGGGATPSPVAGGGGFPGQIESYAGANVYNVRIYPNGLSGSSTVVSVTQLEGDPAFPHSNGRMAIVILAGTSYYMHLPVWS